MRMRAEEVITTHGNTDFDAFASMLAARRLYPNAVIALAGSLNRNVRDFYRLHADELGAIVEASRLDLGAIRRLIAVDTTHAGRLGELERVALDPSVETVVFDHHGGEAPGWVAPERAVLSEDAALTTTLVGVLAERELEPTPLEATAFALGIHEDTGSLTYSGVSTRDAEALAWCLRHGANQDLITAYLQPPLIDEERTLLGLLLDSIEPLPVRGHELLLATAVYEPIDLSVSHLATKLVDLTDAKALAVLVEMAPRVFCVVRSRIPELNAAALAGALGGGGHAQAASASVKSTLAQARRQLLGALESAVRDLSHAPVKGIMSARVATTGEDAPLAELQTALGAASAGRIAVLRDEKVVGVVTRSDVLRALGQPAEARPGAGESLAGELAALRGLQPVWDAIAAVAEPYDGVYLVGGTVRDILLGEANFDVDVAVEGDAISLANALADALGGRVRAHHKFGTAVVLYGGGGRVDVVTARTEFYESPAALPTVEHATIREDLFRRDFTINAMAVSLKGDDFGRLVDPFGGRRDLEAGRIRVLHNLSFIDDPTRIFRAIRYENRLGFRMDEHTERLARGCVEMGLVGDLSSERLRNELIALLEEGPGDHSIVRLREIGVDKAIHSHLAADEEAVELLARLHALREELAIDVPEWRLGLAALARKLPPDEVYGWLERLRVRRSDAERIAAAVTVAPKLVDRLRAGTIDNAELVALADPYAPDAPLFALALEESEELRRYFRELRGVSLEVTGADLAQLGLGESPRVGEILGELRRRKLNGELDGRDSELEAARELIAESA